MFLLVPSETDLRVALVEMTIELHFEVAAGKLASICTRYESIFLVLLSINESINAQIGN